MELMSLIPSIYAKFLAYLLFFTRISALLTTFVLFRNNIITVRTVIALSSVLAVLAMMNYSAKPAAQDLFSLAMFIQLGMQAFIGVFGGIILNIVFETFVAIGQVASTQVGLSFASLVDPRFGYITSLGHFYLIAGTLIFLLMNGHLYMLRALIESFHAIPPDQLFLPADSLNQVVRYAAVIFSGSVLISISLLIVVLLMNISLSVMTKFAPQFNLFTIGINLQLILGLLVLYMTFNLFVQHGAVMLQEGVAFLYRTIG